MSLSRRSFLELSLQGAAALGACALPGPLLAQQPPGERKGDRMAFGLVTYLWGQDWDLATLIDNCQKTGALGVELRTTHAHKVEPSLNDQERADVAHRFADSGVTLVGLGSNERFDDPDPAVVRKAIEASKAFLMLSHDVGGSGVKVKPDRFHEGVPREKTIEQIGRALNELGEFAAGYGQQVRLEVHGQCAELPTIAAIMEIADHDSVAVCWNSNKEDLAGQGLAHNYRLVSRRFGATCHIHELESPDYPFQELFDLLVADDYAGWLLLEASSQPADRVAALADQAARFETMRRKAQEKLVGKAP